MTLEEGGGSNNNVRALKEEIKETEEGAPYDRQELFMLVEGAEDGSDEPLSDDLEIESACSVAPAVREAGRRVGVGRGF